MVPPRPRQQDAVPRPTGGDPADPAAASASATGSPTALTRPTRTIQRLPEDARCRPCPRRHRPRRRRRRAPASRQHRQPNSPTWKPPSQDTRTGISSRRRQAHHRRARRPRPATTSCSAERRTELFHLNKNAHRHSPTPGPTATTAAACSSPARPPSSPLVLLLTLLYYFRVWVFRPIKQLAGAASTASTRGDFDQPDQARLEGRTRRTGERIQRHDRPAAGHLQGPRPAGERAQPATGAVASGWCRVGFLAAGVAHEINNPLASHRVLLARPWNGGCTTWRRGCRPTTPRRSPSTCG